ncbi:MAG: class I SAM-dependent methyltransferase [Thaumarchaeota archaeon]|nr:class I SAM-dependent methyltransferase [Nitrososphaerota archaeon]
MRGRILQYGELAKYYDQIYEWKDYAKEAKTLKSLIRKYRGPPAHTLLDVGCGTGKHIQYLRDEFECTGLDSSRQMLRVARRNVKGVGFVRGEMEDFRLNRRFDVIVSLFSAIGYVKTYRRLGATLRNFANHLNEGGLVIVEPWFVRSEWTPGWVSLRTYNSEDLKLVRMSFSGVRGNLSTIDEHIVVAKRGKGISYYKDFQLLAMFEKDRFLELMSRAGLKSRFISRSLSPGRGLYVGTRVG